MGCFSGSHIIEINAGNLQISFQVLKRHFFSPRIISQNPFKNVSKRKLWNLPLIEPMALNLKTLNPKPVFFTRLTHMNPQPCPSIFLGQRETDLLAEGKKRKYKPTKPQYALQYRNHRHFMREVMMAKLLSYRWPACTMSASSKAF
jgi:hypothetical protein